MINRSTINGSTVNGVTSALITSLATLSAAATISAAAGVIFPCSSGLSAVGDIVSVGYRVQPVAAALDGGASLQGVAVRAPGGSVSLAAQAALTSEARVQIGGIYWLEEGTASITASSGLNALGHYIHSAAAVQNGRARLIAKPARIKQVSVALRVRSRIRAASTVTKLGASASHAQAAITAKSVRRLFGSADCVAGATLAVVGVRETRTDASLDCSAALSALATSTSQGEAYCAASGWCTATAARLVLASGLYPGNGELTAIGVIGVLSDPPWRSFNSAQRAASFVRTAQQTTFKSRAKPTPVIRQEQQTEMERIG